MQLNLMLATQPISIALYHLPAIINSGSELLPVADARTAADTLLDDNLLPWSKQLVAYNSTKRGQSASAAVTSPIVPTTTVTDNVLTPPTLTQLHLPRSTPQRVTACAWLVQQTIPFTQYDIRTQTNLARQTVNDILNDAICTGYVQATGAYTPERATFYRWIGKSNPYQVKE